MATQFDIAAAKGNEMLNRFADYLEVSDETAYRVMGCILQSLRDYCALNDSLLIMAQLPLVLRGLYAQDWQEAAPINPAEHLTVFFQRVRSHCGTLSDFNIKSNIVAAIAVSKFWKVLSEYLPDEQLSKVLSVLSPPLREFAFESITENVYQS